MDQCNGIVYLRNLSCYVFYKNSSERAKFRKTFSRRRAIVVFCGRIKGRHTKVITVTDFS